MKKISVCLLLLLTALPTMPVLRAQELDGSDLRKEAREREERVNKLSIDEQLKLRAAQQKAANDPAVQDALKKRNDAINQFRATMQAAMLRADPSIAPILEKVAFITQPQR
ncbi:MAG TPA: hypothetical protein VGI85_07480 [Chthoniobacterales bacterium]|jgi:hypothetical protein